MLANPATRGLLWKETRQMLPLIGIVTFVGILVTTVTSIAGSFSRESAEFGSAIPWALPACFAAGVAALLVGQEREKKTLSWLAGLPTRPTQLIATKFAVAIGGLIVVWVFSMLLLLFVDVADRSEFIHSSYVFSDLLGFDLVLQSLLILCCGFFTAWRFKSSFVGLVTILPLACAPFISVSLIEWVYKQVTGMRGLTDIVSANLIVASILAWTVVFAALAVRAAKSELSPSKPPRDAELRSDSWQNAWRPTEMRPTPSVPNRFSTSSFIWQSIQQQRWLLAALFATMLVAVVSSTMLDSRSGSSRNDTFGEAIAVATLAAAFAVSWIGVMAFAGDGSAPRLKFLADRGVSPWRTWIGRHLVGISMLSVVTLAYFLMSWWAMTTKDEPSHLLSVTFVGLAIAGIYSVSQWIGQTIPILAGAVIIAPLLSFATFGWFCTASIQLEAPLTWLLLCGLLPIVATLLQMRNYMDGHRGWKAIVAPVLVATVIIVGPAIPFAINVAQTPDISADRRNELLAAANELRGKTSRGEPILQANLGIDRFGGQDSIETYQNAKFGPRDTYFWRRDANQSTTALSADARIRGQLIQSATYAKVSFQLAMEKSNGADLVEWINALTEFATRLRLSPNLLDQDTADWFEIWLIETLNDESIRSIDGIDRAAAIDLLENRERRIAGRTNAVIRAWDPPRTSDKIVRDIGQFGGFRIEAYQQRSEARFTYTHRRTKNIIADALLKLIDAGTSGKSTLTERQQVRSAIYGTDTAFEMSPYADAARMHPVPLTATYYWAPSDVGSLWFAPWEDEAAELAKQLKTELASQDQPETNDE